MLNQEFNNESGYQLNPAELEAEVNKILEGGNLTNANDFETFFRLNGDSSNEASLSGMRDTLDTTGGKSGVKLGGLGEMLDSNKEAFHGDRSSNLTQENRIEHESHAYNTPDHNVPVIGDSEAELEVATASIYEQLSQAGVSETDLNHAMATGGVDDPRATIDAFYDLAQDNNVPIEGYIQGVDQSYANLQIEEGVENVAPAVGTVMDEPELAMNDPEHDPSQPAPNALSFG